MPTITFSLKDLQQLVGKKLSIEELKELAYYAKGSVEDYNKATDEIKIDFGDTNLPYLWSVEGFARLLKGLLGKEMGLPKIKIINSNYKLMVDSSVKTIRPYISAFVAKGFKINDYLIKQLIQLQEKLCENYGRRRKKIAIGIYNYQKIKFPIHYKATLPNSIKFVPLDFDKELTQQEILSQHPKGREYGYILEGFKKYPILIDSANQVLSFPPIINSELTGRVNVGDNSLFFEATGLNIEEVLLATNIFAYALYDRGFKIYSVEVIYPTKKMITPRLDNETITVTSKSIKNLLGLDLDGTAIKRLVEKLRYGYEKGNIKVPPYRVDILHEVDIIEDIAISYGYDNITELEMKSYTVGSTSPLIHFINKIRECIIGLGYQEIMSPILTNKTTLYKKMCIGDFGTVEIEEYVSKNYSVVRTWLLPILLEVLSKNKHVEYPQKIFEQGTVTVRKHDKVIDYERLALVTAHEKANYTEVKQVFDYLMRMLDINYEMVETEHNSFIPGRVARAKVNNKKIAFIGEISPAVLENFELIMPVAGFELNLTELFELVKKSPKE